MQVCRQGRDAVLRWAKKITLKLGSDLNNPGPVAGLLSRATQLSHCNQFVLTSFEAPDGFFAELVHSCKDWVSVHTLYLQGSPVGAAVAHFTVSSFPRLRELHLRNAQLGQGELLSELHKLCQLTTIALQYCRLDEDAVDRSAAALRSLQCLREFDMSSDIPFRVAAGLTQLTRLELRVHCGRQDRSGPLSAALKLCTGLHQLQSLGLEPNNPTCKPQQLAQLLTTCTKLKDLAIDCGIDQQGLDVILAHGSHLTSLRLGFLSVSVSRAAAAAAAVCAPKHLEWGEGGDIREWINLPLQSVEVLRVREQEGSDAELPYRAGSRFVSLPLQADEVAPQDLPALLRQAATNLAGCPAWRASQPKPPVELFTTSGSEFDSNTRIQLLCALTPVMDGVTIVYICMEGFKLGGAEVQALGSSISSTLTQLNIWDADVQRDFLPAVWPHLPALGTLAIMVDWKQLWPDIALDVTLFCSRAPHPFTLLVSEDVLDRMQSDQLMRCCRVWGSPQVTIRKFSLKDFPGL